MSDGRLTRGEKHRNQVCDVSERHLHEQVEFLQGQDIPIPWNEGMGSFALIPVTKLMIETVDHSDTTIEATRIKTSGV